MTRWRVFVPLHVFEEYSRPVLQALKDVLYAPWRRYLLTLHKLQTPIRLLSHHGWEKRCISIASVSTHVAIIYPFSLRQNSVAFHRTGKVIESAPAACGLRERVASHLLGFKGKFLVLARRLYNRRCTLVERPVVNPPPPASKSCTSIFA